jgi:hypothetical protein
MDAHRRFEHEGRSRGPHWGRIAEAVREEAAALGGAAGAGSSSSSLFGPSPKQCAIRFHTILMPKLGGAKFNERWTASEVSIHLMEWYQHLLLQSFNAFIHYRMSCCC